MNGKLSETTKEAGVETAPLMGNRQELLHLLLEQVARSRPDAVALIGSSGKHTFSSMNRFANHVAHELVNHQVGRNALIAVWSADPAMQLILTFGVWKAGLAAVILDPRDSGPRMRWILGHAGVDAVITDSGSAQRAARAGSGYMVLRVEPRDVSLSAPVLDVMPEATAVVIFTSGSEGQPKGVLRTHRGMVLQCRRRANQVGLGSRDRVVQLLPLNFSSGLRQALSAVFCGSTLCFYDALSRGLAPYYDWFRNERITVMPSPVAFFRRILHHASASDDLTTCRRVVLGGERLFKRDVDNFRRVFPKACELIYTYGATETGGIATYVIRRDTPVADPIPVGHPEEGTEIRIVKVGVRRFRELPAGEVGQIAVLSSDLPPGYWKDSVSTERKYRPLPANDGTRMYLTGDFGRIGEDGLLYLYNRNDTQLKVRGYRVDISEIETALNCMEDVLHAVVMTSEDNSRETRLVAYLTVTGEPGDQQGLISVLRKTVAAKLPPYMVPDEFVILDVMPTTIRGKVDRRALSTVTLGTEKPETEETTETERKVIEVWKTVFQTEQISLDDDILDMGVKSLAGMEACLMLGRMFSIEVPYTQLTLSPTARWLAAFIDSQLAKKKTKG